MAALVGNLTSVWSPFDWTLLFARQPEPDLEFTEEELDQTITTKARGPLNPRKKSGGGSPILWVLLLALVGGIAYVSMEPEMLTEWLSPYLGESTPPPPVTMKPKPATPAPVAPPAPAPQAAPSPNTRSPSPLGSSNLSRHCRRPCCPSSRSTSPNGSKTRCTSRTSSQPDVQRRTESDRHSRRNGSRRKHSVVRRFIEQQAWANRSSRGLTDRHGR